MKITIPLNKNVFVNLFPSNRFNIVFFPFTYFSDMFFFVFYLNNLDSSMPSTSPHFSSTSSHRFSMGLNLPLTVATSRKMRLIDNCHLSKRTNFLPSASSAVVHVTRVSLAQFISILRLSFFPQPLSRSRRDHVISIDGPFIIRPARTFFFFGPDIYFFYSL
jgi:hypothetical protein